MTGISSTLKRPSAALLATFRIEQIGQDTIRSYLEKGYSLAICCRDCPRITEWSPPELRARFGAKLDLPIIDLAARLVCTGEDGCGSHDIAVFPHFYDRPWKWPPSEQQA